MDKIASSKGLSKLGWYGGGTERISFAKVTYEGQEGFMKCISKGREEIAFDASIINIIYSSA
jgi:hypothetical protein